MKKYNFLSGIFIGIILLAACGADSGSGVNEDGAGNDSVTNAQVYSGDIEDKGESLRYELSVSDNGACIFDQYYLNDDGSYVLYHSEGTAEKTDYGYYVLYTIGGDELYGEIYTDGDVIIGAYSDYLNINNEYSEIAGMYDCKTDSDILLSVDKSGTAKLAVGDVLYENTQLYIYEDNWDLMVFNESNELLYDWLVAFNEDGTFEYIDYAEAVYSSFAGEYTCEGPLGEFVIEINTRGECTAEITVDNTDMVFTGIVTSYGDSLISSIMESDEGVQLTLNFEENKAGDTVLTYKATYTIDLGR